MVLTQTQRLQLYLGDTIIDKGPRPDGLNYSPDELAEFTSQGGNLNGSVIIGLLTLAGEWSSFALLTQEEGVQFSAISVANNYRKQADEYRKNPISLVGIAKTAIPLKRLDAYSLPQSSNI